MRSIVITFFLLCTLSFAQTSSVSPAGSAVLKGSVTDSTGAVLPAASVTVSKAGGTPISTTTDPEGKWTVRGLAPGDYSITVSAAGFAPYQADGFKVEEGDQNLLESQLQAAGEKTEVTVTGASATQIQLDTAELSGTLTQKDVVAYGLNGRNFSQLITLSPGVSNQTQQDEAKVGVVGSAKYSVNGGRVEYNTFDVDGSDVLNTGIAASRGRPTLSVYPSVDAISEIKILTSNYGAQYGRSASGTIVVTTKSGTEKPHGNAYEFLRNETFNARGFKDPVGPAPLYRRQDFGFTLGGPLFIPGFYNTKRDKSFFFFSEEFRFERSPYSFTQAVPSDNERAGNFSDVCPIDSSTSFTASVAKAYPDCPLADQATSSGFTNNLVPTDGNAKAVLQTNIIPHANSPGGCAYQLANPVAAGDPSTWPCYDSTVSPATYFREELFRIDHNITPNLKASFRYIHDSWDTSTVTPQWQYGSSLNSFPTVLNRFFGPGLDIIAHFNSILSPTLINDYSVGFITQHISLNNLPGPGADLTRPARLDAACGESIGSCGIGTIFPVSGGKIPAINISGSNAAYGGSGFLADTSFEPWHNANPTITVRDDLSKSVGKHLFQAGLLFLDAQQSEESSATGANTGDVQGLLTFNNVSNTRTTRNAFADFLRANGGGANVGTGNGSGSIGEIVTYQQDSAQHLYSNHYLVFEPYFQDDWKVTPRLTLNLGIRFSLFGNWTPNGSNVFNFVPGKFDSGLSQTLQVDPSYGFIRNSSGQPILANSLQPDPATLNGLEQCGVNGVPASCMTSHRFNTAPRIGFAWNPDGKGRTSLRAGYGVFWEHGTGDEANSGSLTGSAPLVQTTTQNAPNGGEFSWECIGGSAVGCSPNIPTGVAFPLDLSAIPVKAIWPYVQQWSLSVQRQLDEHTVATFAYVGSKGTHLATVRQLNQFDPLGAAYNQFDPHEPIYADNDNTLAFRGVCATGPKAGNPNQPFQTENGYRYYSGDPGYFNLEVACTSGVNPNSSRKYNGFGRVLSVENLANSSYSAFQTALHHVQGPLDLGVSYTFGHSIDEASDRFASALGNSLVPKFNRASSDFDQREILNISYIYQLPFKQILQTVMDENNCFPAQYDADCRKAHPPGSSSAPDMVKKLFSSWQLSGITTFQTGTPFSVINGGSGLISAVDNAGVANGLGASSYPDVIRNAGHCNVNSVNTSTSFVLGPLLGNRCNFVAPRGLTFGDSGRNYLNNPHRLNFDVALFRQFPIHESYTVEARVEAFNVFNHEQFRLYNPDKGNTASNTVTCYGDQSADFSAAASSCDAGNSFLHPVDAHRPRTMQFGVKLSF